MMNEKQSKVWVIEKGEYSDYSVVGVFSTEENARRVAELTGGSVAEWPLDPNIAEINQGLQVYLVHMLKDGSVEQCKRLELNSYALTTIGVTMWRRSQAPAFRGQDKPDLMQATVWAKDEEHAIKITNEHRAEWIASGKWGND